MTKGQTEKVARYLRKNVDEPIICAMQYEKEDLAVFSNNLSDPVNTAAMYGILLGTLFKRLHGTPELKKEFRQIFIDMLTDVAEQFEEEES